MTSDQQTISLAVHTSNRVGRWAAALLLAATSLLAACGGSSDTPAGDTTAPTVTITDNVATPPAKGDVTFTFTFSEDIGTSFAASDVTVTGGTKAATVTKLTTPPNTYTLLVSPPANLAGTIAVSVAAGAFTDVAGNANAAAASMNRAYDTQFNPAFPTISFDSSSTTYTFTDFGGNAATKVADPTNAANQVAKVIKSATAELWAGTTVSTGASDTVPRIPFDASNTRMSVKVYSPTAGIKVRLKAEDHTNGAVSVETEATTTAVNTWETLIFDFASQAPGTAALNVASTYDRVSIFFNFGVTGATAGEKTYYFDNLAFIGGGGIVVAGAFASLNFEPATGVTYTLTDFGGNASSLVVDPTNAANHVVKVIKTGAAETWAGTTFSTAAADSVGVIAFTAARTKMSVRVYSPDAGVHVRLKVENSLDPTKSVETEALTTVVNTWETLTFDFTVPTVPPTAALNLAYTYDKASIFFNFAVAGATAGEKTYHFDDVVFVP